MSIEKLAFVCQGNAGRSQLATALAERERNRRGHDIEIVTGGIDPADQVHSDVRAVLAEAGIDIGDRTPRRIRAEDVADADVIVTMGCTAADFAPDDWDGRAIEWDVDHPGTDDRAGVRAQRDVIDRRVSDLFDTINEE